MTASDDLFRLISSLSPSEKRYFKLFASRQGLKDAKQYILLFDLIDKQEDYNEAKLKKKLKKISLIKALPRLKNYLHNLIMRSMRSYKNESNISNTIFEMLQDEQFYKDKGLYDLRVKTLLRAKEIAKTYEFTYLQFPVLLNLKLARINYTKGNPFAIINSLHSEEEELLENLIAETKLGQLQTSLWAQYIEDPLLNDKSKIEGYNALKNSTLLQKYEVLKTFKSKWYFLRSHCLICRFNNDNVGALPFYRKIIELFDDNLHQKQADMHEYKVALNNYLAACHRAGYYDDFFATLSKVESIEMNSVNEQINTFHLVSNNKLLYALNTGDLSRKDKMLKDIESGFKKYGSSIKEKSKMVVYYNMCIMCFLSLDFQKALDYSTMLLNMQSETRKDLQTGSKLLQLIIQYELHNTFLLESLLRNTARNLQKENKYYAFEKLLISYLKKLLKCLPYEKKEYFIQLRDELLLLKMSDTNFKFVIMDEALIWCTGKINNTTHQKELQNLIIANYTQLHT